MAGDKPLYSKSTDKPMYSKSTDKPIYGDPDNCACCGGGNVPGGTCECGTCSFDTGDTVSFTFIRWDNGYWDEANLWNNPFAHWWSGETYWWMSRGTKYTGTATFHSCDTDGSDETWPNKIVWKATSTTKYLAEEDESPWYPGWNEPTWLSGTTDSTDWYIWYDCTENEWGVTAPSDAANLTYTQDTNERTGNDEITQSNCSGFSAWYISREEYYDAGANWDYARENHDKVTITVNSSP